MLKAGKYVYSSSRLSDGRSGGIHARCLAFVRTCPVSIGGGGDFAMAMVWGGGENNVGEGGSRSRALV